MEFFSLTDVGLVREKNQDSYMTVYNPNGDFLAVVCDGIGGHKAGEVASGEAIKTVSEIFAQLKPFNEDEDVYRFLITLSKVVNSHIYSLAQNNIHYYGMGTTLCGLLFTKLGVFNINIGDSRAYGFKEHRLFRLTKDHTYVNDLLEQGQITYEESLNHPKKHYLLRAVGPWEDVNPDICKVQMMDYYLLCSDGLHAMVDDEKILKIVDSPDDNILRKTKELMQTALLNGGLDNITVILIKR